MQDRFYTLLKRRLRAEIERNPPLFPWESEVCDYEAEYSDSVAPGLVPSNFWAAQLKNLSLPVPMPEAVLMELFSQCQTVMQSTLKQGAKLVQAVEPLFPGQSQTLNQLAGLVIASDQVRSGGASSSILNAVHRELPAHYNAANSVQQMALSLVAAHTIIDSLSLTVLPSQPKAQRQWITHAGLMTLTVDYLSQPTSRLHIEAHLPGQGMLRLTGPHAQSIAQCFYPGHMSVEMLDVEPGQVYSLEVNLEQSKQSSLTFAIQIASD